VQQTRLKAARSSLRARKTLTSTIFDLYAIDKPRMDEVTT
jgi:hypothetical protein